MLTFQINATITYKMTRAQHREMLVGMWESIDQALQEMIDSADYNFQDITYNSNMSEFEATMTTTEMGLGDSFSVIAFYMYGGMYQIFCGDKSESIVGIFKTVAKCLPVQHERTDVALPASVACVKTLKCVVNWHIMELLQAKGM